MVTRHTGTFCSSTMDNKPKRPIGRGSAINPPNRFTGAEIEMDWDHLEGQEDVIQEFQRPRTRYFEDSARSIVSENDSPDIPFRYSLNPYRGCLHGCAYCYARPTHEFYGLSAGLDFETNIFVKKDAAGLFQKWLNRPGYQPENVMLSGVTDCYQPGERHFRLTRACLEVANLASQPVSIVTKNSLIKRDIDILSKMADRQLVHVAVSVTSLDQSLSRVMEPACSAPSSRLATIRTLSQSGIPVQVMIGPVIPGLTDHEMPEILRQAAASGASTAGYILLRLPRAVEDIFSNWLKEVFPEKTDKVINQIRSTRGGQLSSSTFHDRMVGSGILAEQIQQLFTIAAQKAGLTTKLPTLRTDLFNPPESGGQLHLF